MMMNYWPDAASSAGQWFCNNDNAGEAALPTMGESSSVFEFADMVADYSTDDLFELVREQEGQDGGASGPAVSCLWSPRFSSKPPDVRLDPPSEDEMAAWLSTIVKGEEFACNDNDGGGRQTMADGRRPIADDGRDLAPAKMGMTATDKKEKVPTTGETTTTGNKEMRKVPAGGSSRRSHHREAHNLTEKRRRHKINEKLKTLQQLVPGCSKSNQASTLDQTIHYMKSLQHQVQAMSVGLAAPAVYPVVQPQCVPPGTPVAIPFPAAQMVLSGRPPSTMVPVGTTMLQLPHYPGTAVMMPAAAVAPLYPAAAPTSTAVAPGDTMSANRLHGSSSRSSRKAKCSSTACAGQSDRT